ncbi:UbiX family flavin prenyltransferase [candidate division KSB1 bacterium]|nr:UbiX family flavin prenyltransferase [candidate division KSB1 bacterium]
MRYIVCITGASGVIIGFRLIQELLTRNLQVHVVITPNARKVITVELGDHYTLPSGAYYHDEEDSFAPLNSSSFLFQAAIIVPCSIKTLSSIANGFSNSLTTRIAENALRTRSTLIVVPRETPLSASALENMLSLRRDGAIIFPPSIAYYHRPTTVEDVTDFFVGKILDLLQIPNDLYRRWGMMSQTSDKQ